MTDEKELKWNLPRLLHLKYAVPAMCQYWLGDPQVMTPSQLKAILAAIPDDKLPSLRVVRIERVGQLEAQVKAAADAMRAHDAGEFVETVTLGGSALAAADEAQECGLAHVKCAQCGEHVPKEIRSHQCPLGTHVVAADEAERRVLLRVAEACERARDRSHVDTSTLTALGAELRGMVGR